MKAQVTKTETPLEDLKARIELMMEINQNSLEIGTLSGIERSGLEYQNNALTGVIVLVDQLRKRGAIWKGGYLDNVGVVYEDQLQVIVEEQEAVKLNDQLDDELSQRLS